MKGKMEEFIDEKVHYSKKIRAELGQLRNTLIIAIIISFLVNILANSLFSYVIGGSLTYSLFTTIGVAIFFLIVSLYLLYKSIPLPTATLSQKTAVPLPTPSIPQFP
jgi:hypothetical protein